MKVLLIEDDQKVVEMVRACLLADNNMVEVATDGANGSFLARSFDYDAIVLDNSLPKKDGLTICEEVRAAGRMTPILFLTVADDLKTKMAAFANGADDYLQKPFSLQELEARLKAITRRPNLLKETVIKSGDIELNTEKHLVIRAGREIHLTRKEFNLLQYFMENAGVVLSRALLIEHVWTAESNPFSNTVEAHVRNLRKKINAADEDDFIANIPGRGYVFNNPTKSS
ncbi:MAG: response regulator transcription factor [Candidatus Paceibacterota bacterium]|jgi:DNA-binding response OmpR family regulator